LFRNKKNRNDLEPGLILTGNFNEMSVIEKYVSLKVNIIAKIDEEPSFKGTTTLTV